MQAGAYVKDDACRALILLVVNAAQLHGYAARAAWRALSGSLDKAQPSLLMVATWCLGEWSCWEPVLWGAVVAVSAVVLRVPAGATAACRTRIPPFPTTHPLTPPLTGEYGELLVGPEAGKLLEGEPPVSASEADLVGLLEAVAQVWVEWEPDLGGWGGAWAVGGGGQLNVN